MPPETSRPSLRLANVVSRIVSCAESESGKPVRNKSLSYCGNFNGGVEMKAKSGWRIDVFIILCGTNDCEGVVGPFMALSAMGSNTLGQGDSKLREGKCN